LQHLAVADKVEANTEPLRAPARQLPITWLQPLRAIDTTAENLATSQAAKRERRRAKGWGAYRNALLASGTCREPTLQLLLASTATGMNLASAMLTSAQRLTETGDFSCSGRASTTKSENLTEYCSQHGSRESRHDSCR
jgi:hypothetical protein